MGQRDGAETTTSRREMLGALARELRRAGGPAARRGWTLRGVPYLSVRRPGRRRLRVYCVSAGGGRAFLTGTGQLVSAAAGIPGAAGEIAAAAGGPAARTAAPRTAAPPGS